MSKKQHLFLLLVFCGMASAVVAYSIATASDPLVSLKGVPLEVLIYQNGSPEKVGTLPADSLGVAAIQTLLKAKTGRWRTSFATYVPFIYIRSHDFRLNIHPNLMIMNYRVREGNFTQVVTDLTAEEFERASLAISRSFAPEPMPR